MENQEEVWKEIPNYEGLYQSSSLGNIKSLKRRRVDSIGRNQRVKERILKPRSNNAGYYYVGLASGATIKTWTVHQLIAITFKGHTPSGHSVVVDHINSIKTDNRAVNLQLITPRENVTKATIKSTSLFTGVSWSKRGGNWNSQIKIKGKVVFLGYFSTELEASYTYQKALFYIEFYMGDSIAFRDCLKLI